MTARRLALAAKAFGELGPRQLWDYARYRGSLRLGILRWQTSNPHPAPDDSHYKFSSHPIFILPDRDRISHLIGNEGMAYAIRLADEISEGKVRLFGSSPVDLRLETDLPLAHWTEYELGNIHAHPFDYKQIWEPGRFGWGINLARVYHLTGDEQYAQVFWKYTGQFLKANPAYLGVHWVSAQEAALRLIALAFCFEVFRHCVVTTPERSAMLAQVIAIHAWRIPPSLSYARSQNNNHLINEAAGLYTAGAILPDHPQASSWRKTGWRWLNHAFQTQIADDGAYVQHSANYHRLILQTALWVRQIAAGAGGAFPEATRLRLRSATLWLLTLLDRNSGRAPNLGPNDGAHLFPLSDCPFEDYRPVLQAAAQTFLGYAPLETGAWDELRLWMCADLPAPASGNYPAHAPHQSPHRLDNPGKASWAYLRAATFKYRPGHADQLHLDLWWQGTNLAQDAGSYLYNDPPPWDNALGRTAVHNTICVDGMDQMTLAGRFLWLDWAQARLIEHARAEDDAWERLTASHDGYRRLGVTHQRSVTCFRHGEWLVEDSLQPTGSSPMPERRARLHWLLPDWPWRLEVEMEETRLVLSTPQGNLAITVRCESTEQADGEVAVSLARAGELLSGTGPVEPASGWVSLTYTHKSPALSLAVEQTGRLPIRFTTQWTLP
jgi:hypothetical protein